MKDYMPPGGVKELQRSESGRRYLGKLQKKYSKDILQPGQPGFRKAWGAKVDSDARNSQRQKDESKEIYERKAFDDRRKNDVNSERVY